MEFLKTCSTNAQAVGDFEAIAYQAFSITRSTSPPPSRLRDWSPSEDIRAVEAELRQGRQLVAQDASRPWLWLFKPISVDKMGQGTVELQELDGYRLQREQAGFMKASELARPPMRTGNPHALANSAASSSTTAPHKGMQGGGARSTQSNVNSGAAENHQPPDCFTIYELFAASVTALISFFLVRHRNIVALNYRTFVSKPIVHQGSDYDQLDYPADLYWLTSVDVHWVSSGTLLLSTFTERTHELRCLDEVATDEEKPLVGTCIRVAPNASLATISSFDDPLDTRMDDTDLRKQRKRTKTGSLEQSIEKWKVAVKRWLSWRGYSLPNLEKRSSWVRIRAAHMTQLSMTSPVSSGPDRDILWPRALCFVYHTESNDASISKLHDGSAAQAFSTDLKWFERPGYVGFKDPLDVAQEWFLGKPNRDKILEARRKVKKTEEEAARRKEEPSSLFPSSPFNARTGMYGDLQAVSGVYPTPPDGVAPGPGVSTGDTPSVSGAASNVILVPGGTNPTINLSAPQDHPPTSPPFPISSDNFHASGFNDDLFEDMEEDGSGGHGINDADFDFFDQPDGEDVDMADAPVLPQTNVEAVVKHKQKSEPIIAPEPPLKEEASDPFTALENALATASQEVAMEAPTVKSEQTTTMQASPAQELADALMTLQTLPQAHKEQSQSKEPTPPLSPGLVAKTLQPSPPHKSTSREILNKIPTRPCDGIFHPLDFSRRLSLVDAKYQEGRFAAHHDTDPEKDHDQSKPGAPQIKSLRDMPLLTKLRYSIGVASVANIPEVMSLARAASDNSDSSSETSDQYEEDSEEDVSTGPPSILGRLIIPAKRKLPTEGNGTPLSVTSFADSLGGDWHDIQGLQLDGTHLASFEPSSWDWSLINLPPPSERSLAGARYAMPSLSAPIAQLPDTPTSQPDISMESSDEKPLSGKDSIAITQIVTDQIISATLDVLGEDASVTQGSTVRSPAESHWQLVIKDLFPKAVECNISALAAVHDVFPDLSAQGKGNQRPPPRKPNEGSAVPANHMYQINPPFVRVRRAETQWDLLPPSIAFWEPLGLSPVNPSKSVVAFCVYPHSVSLRPCLETFMLSLQLAFDSCKFGTHTRVETVIEYEGGLVPWKVASPTTQKDALNVLKDTCIQLGKLLAIQHAQIREQQDAKVDAFVIYIIDPFGDPSALWELCSAFWALFQAYGQGPPGRADPYQKPDLVLQVVPIKYIASFDTPVVLDSSTFISLAREVYERCPPNAPSADKTPLSIYSAPAFQLEEVLPRGIPFKLVSEPPQDLLRENSYMHLAYAISLDGTWITAAWTDNCGKSQAVVSYHLGTRAFGEIAKDMWQTTIEILQSRRVHWRVCIAKAGVMDREELETWVFLITCPTQVNLFLTLLTVDTEPPYKLTPTMPTSSGTAGSTTTPGSTPKAGVSPDPAIGLTPAATPSADAAADPASDPEARLIDVTDETWGIILAHRLHNSNSTNQFSPALISGLLVKRGETYATSDFTHHPIPDPLSGPIVVAVNILWIGAVGSTRAATSPFPPPPDGVSPGGYAAGGSSAPPSPGPAQERSTSSLMWTPTVQTRSTAENLLKEVLGHFRALGLLAKLKGMRGTRHGSVPWHVVAAQRGVKGLGRVVGGV